MDWFQESVDRQMGRTPTSNKRASDGNAAANQALVFRTKCHPEANGGTPRHGDQEWRLTFPLENGESLVVLMGKEGRENMMGMLVQEVADDLFE